MKSCYNNLRHTQHCQNSVCLVEEQQIPNYSPWFDSTGARTSDLYHSRQAYHYTTDVFTSKIVKRL